jgi:hypothetical protein
LLSPCWYTQWEECSALERVTPGTESMGNRGTFWEKTF